MTEVWGVSYPRSGKNWLWLMLEHYHGGPVFSNRLKNPDNPEEGRDNWIGKWDHYPRGLGGKIIYLYRNPIDVMKSMCGMNTSSLHSEVFRRESLEDQVRFWVKEWEKHMFLYHHTVPAQGALVHYVKYENMLKQPELELANVATFIWGDWDAEKIEKAVNAFNTKDDVNGCIYEKQQIGDPWYTRRELEEFDWNQILDWIDDKILELVE
jgi:hypothetical protein